jgi:hypothetical protein
MAKRTWMAIIAAALASALAGAAQAQNQDNGLVAPELAKPAPGQLLDRDYLTGTGATVPHPGVPQASGPTPLDRAIQRQDNQIDNSICKGC